MIGKRGIRKVSTRVRLAVAAAVLVGGGAAGVVAVAANHGGVTAAQSAGYYTHSDSDSGRWMSETQAMSGAMNGWNQSPSRSLELISHMQPMSSFTMMGWHTHTIALQRGVVVAEAIRQKELVVESFNGNVEVWHWNGGTKAVNVGGNSTAWSAMTGGTMSMPSSWDGRLNLKAKAAIKGDLVFVFGERVDGQLIAQLVLFAAPLQATAPMPTMPTPTAMPSVAGIPALTPTSNVQVQAPNATSSSSFTGTHS